MVDQTCRNLLISAHFFARKRSVRTVLKVRSQCSFSSRCIEQFGQPCLPVSPCRSWYGSRGMIRQSNFLPSDSRAEWIVFPVAVSSGAHWFTGLDATFRREFVLTDRPSTARLSIRAMRRAEVKSTALPFAFHRSEIGKRLSLRTWPNSCAPALTSSRREFSITMDHRHSGSP